MSFLALYRVSELECWNNKRISLVVSLQTPPFQSRRDQGKTPYQFALGDEREGQFSPSALPDLYPVTLDVRAPSTLHQFRYSEAAWGWIEFLPNSNRDFIEEVLVSAREFRGTHRTPQGYSSAFQYLPQHPYPLWTLGLSRPELPAFEAWTPLLGDRPVAGGFAFVDTCSFWAIYGQHIGAFGTTFLCIHTHHCRPSHVFTQGVRDLASDNQLCLVDWGRLCIVPTTDSLAFENWLWLYT